MTVEELHDALTLLPADLVAEADRRRSRKPHVILWHRWTAMAACLVLVLSCGLLVQSQKTKQAFPEMASAAGQAAPMEAAVEQGAPQAESEDSAPMARGSAAMDQGGMAAGILDITWVETPSASSVNISGTPRVFLIHDAEALEAYLSDCVFINADGLRESTAGYDEAWFASHDLVLIRLACPSGTTVGDIQETDGQWEITLQPSSLSLQGYYHILVDVEKGRMESADQVTISYDEPYTDIQ